MAAPLTIGKAITVTSWASCRSRTRRPYRRVARRARAKGTRDHVGRSCRLEVADHAEDRVVGGVVGGERLANVIEARGGEGVHRAEGRGKGGGLAGGQEFHE